MTVINIRKAPVNNPNVLLLDKLVAEIYLTDGRMTERAKDLYREVKEILENDHKTNNR